MSDRPSRKVQPTAKLGASNTAHLEISWQRSIVQSARAAEDRTQGNGVSGQSRLSGFCDELPAPADSVPPQITLKRPKPLSESIPSSSPTTGSGGGHATAILPTPPLKKAKTVSDASLAETKASIAEITEISDDDEHLNKTDLTADIKEFFTSMPCVLGQNKRRMKCNLCTCVILHSFCIHFRIL